MSKTVPLLAQLAIYLSPFIGTGSLLLFVAFLFFGPFHLIFLDLSPGTILCFNTSLSCLFFFQHSFMVRKSIQTRIEKFIPAYFYNALYGLVSSFTLCLVILCWQPHPFLLYDLNVFFTLILRGLFFSALMGTIWGAYALKNFDPFGKTQIQNHFKDHPQEKPYFKAKGPYLYVRHPLYFFTLILIWSPPSMTVDRALFNLLWTIWIIIGTILEERDLLMVFGDTYRQYQKKIPMLVPWKIRQIK